MERKKAPTARKTVHRGWALGVKEARLVIEAALGEEGGRR